MSPKRTLYHAHFDQCRAQADLACNLEAAAVWMTIADSWQFLMDHENPPSDESPKSKPLAL